MTVIRFEQSFVLPDLWQLPEQSTLLNLLWLAPGTFMMGTPEDFPG